MHGDDFHILSFRFVIIILFQNFLENAATSSLCTAAARDHLMDVYIGLNSVKKMCVCINCLPTADLLRIETVRANESAHS